ncbi:RtcB family protein, partial [bacterium]
SILTNGLTGLLENYKDLKDKGIWKYYNEHQQREDILSVNDNGSIATDKTNNFEDFLGSEQFTYDNQSGSIGGGNHFVELQKVSEVLDSQTAYAWGLKKDSIVIMVHTGSVSLGHLTGSYAKEMLKEIYPKSLKHPDNGIYPLPESEKYKSQWDIYHSSLANSANFAFVNRLLLGLMLQRAITETIRECQFKLIYDASHNIVKKYDNYSYIHRKGACPARGCDAMTNPKFSYYGEPVFIPGSMGSKSYIMAGTGNKENLCSASHGAGRKLSRGQALKEDNSKFEEFIKNFKIITPIDSNSDLIKKRSDILKKWQEDIKKEAPYAYKDISPIIDVHVENNMAKPVVELIPLFTIKG